HSFRARSSKRCGTNSRNQYNCATSTIRRAETTRNAGPQLRFGGGAFEVHAAFEKCVDQRANDFGAVQRFAALAATVARESIEVKDLAIEEHHRHLGPGFLVDGRTSRARFRSRV